MTHAGAELRAGARCTATRLRQLLRTISPLYDGALVQAGLKVTQLSLLAQVQRRGPIRPVDLAARHRMTASTLSRNLRPLLAAGCLRLLPGPDARSQLVELTAAGEARLQAAGEAWRGAQADLDARLGPELARRLQDVVEEALAQMAPRR